MARFGRYVVNPRKLDTSGTRAIVVAIACGGLLAVINTAAGIVLWNESPDQPLRTWVLVSWFNSFTLGTSEGNVPSGAELLVLFQQVITVCLLAVLGGSVYRLVANPQPNLCLANVLTFRLRPMRLGRSNEDDVVLSLQVVNKSKEPVWDVRCSMLFTHLVPSSSLGKPGVFLTTKDHYDSFMIPLIATTFRFSFLAIDIDPKVLRSFLGFNPHGNFDTVTVIIRGKYGRFGGDFMKARTYEMSDIQIAKGHDYLAQHRIDASGKLIREEFYENLSRSALVYYDDAEHQRIVEILNNIASGSAL